MASLATGSGSSGELYFVFETFPFGLETGFFFICPGWEIGHLDQMK